MAERKPLPERHAWLRGELSRKANDDLAAEILQSWLLGAHRPMVCGFLDRLHVPHDGEGLLESLPAEPPEADLRAAVNDLLTNHPREAACVYLHLFSEMDIAAGWSHLRDLIPSSLCPNPPVPAA